MPMYDELIKNLRETDFSDGCPCGAENLCKDNDCLIWQAADAIEELSRRETPMKITEIHVDEYYCPACGAENNCDQGYVQDAYCPSCGQCLLPEPPKEET